MLFGTHLLCFAAGAACGGRPRPQLPVRRQAVDLHDAAAHLLPGEAAALLDAVFAEAAEHPVGIHPLDGIGHPLRGRLADIAHAAVGYDLGQPPDARDDHRHAELVGDLRHAALRCRLVGLHDEIGRREVVFDPFVGDEVVVENHLVGKAVSGDLPQVGLLRGVELARDDQPAARRAARAPEQRPGIEQQVQPLVVAHQSEEEHVAAGRVEPQPHARLPAVDTLAEVLEERVRREERRRRGVGLQLAVHLLGHVDEAVDRTQEVAVEGAVDEVVLVRLDVVDLADHLRVSVAAGQAGDRPEAGGHEGRPVLHEHEVGPFAPDEASDAQPVEGVDRIDTTDDMQVLRRRRREGLALPGKEQRGVLQREGADVDLRSAPLERAGHDLHDRSQSAPVGMGGSQNRNLHKTKIPRKSDKPSLLRGF